MASRTIIELLLQSPSLASLEKIVREEPSLLIEHLWDAPKAALLALVQKATHQPIVVITESSREERLLDDLPYFGLDAPIEFPSWETLPGEEITPSPDIVGKRLEILFDLSQRCQTTLPSSSPPKLILCSLQACLQKILPPHLLQEMCCLWKKGEEIPFFSIPDRLQSLGYVRSTIASDKGEFAVRGGIIDLFPVHASDPFRLEFFGDTLEEIRTYDPISQKSIAKQDSLFISPANELQLLEQTASLASLLDYIPANAILVFNDLLALEDRYVALKSQTVFSRYFTPFEHLFSTSDQRQRIFLAKERIEELSKLEIHAKKGRAFYTGKDPLQPLRFELISHQLEAKRWRHPFVETSEYFSTIENRASSTPDEILQGIQRSQQALDLHLICSNEREELSLREKLGALPKKTTFEKGYLSSGFVLSDSLLTLLPMTELTHRYKVRRQKWRNTYHTPAAEFHELAPGDIVVHFHHGIGRYLGVEKTANHLGQATEFMVIEYAESGKLFVPIQQAHLVSRYIGSQEEIPTFHTIGGKQWQRAKLQAERSIIGYAHDLLRLQAERTFKGGVIYPEDGPDMQAFEEEFPYIETDDQARAIHDLKQDMQSNKAMDRLVCGDVGYGKTEVAMRAAFKAVSDGQKQVAILVPTTVLALQHYENFSARMANFPLEIAAISRFHSVREVKKTLEKVREGKVDILIGTHRLVSEDVEFHNLGLVIIDEEQRFGVRAKEHLKKIKTGVDCLTLSATPIPRTLYMSLIGAREISVINTPPHDRLPIRTFISERDPATIRQALLRELTRDGQAFFIHNRVETIFGIQKELQEMLPEARIVVAHGQMHAAEIDTVFHAFKSGEADILIATTIVENGIDIPNANTILIDRADRFGLADLYQMRGRVGRWNRPAYAYFLTPLNRPLTELSRKRLYALVEASGYGGGMKIAMRDHRIRGAGDILGTQQSGQIATIGFHLYCKLLKRAIDALQSNTQPDFCETKMEFAYDARLPEEYIVETSLRMEIYHRFGDAKEFTELDRLIDELRDRFGPCPPPVLWLKALTHIKIAASRKRITLLKFDRRTLLIERSVGKETRKQLYPLAPVKHPHELQTQVLPLL